MKRLILPAIACAFIAPMATAQSAVDALQLTQGDFKGTARFMSMGGAFTALGGDLSSMTVNPAGIGVYRRNEFGATVDLNVINNSTENGPSVSNTLTKFRLNNVGYVGTSFFNGGSTTFSWGFNYNRAVSFDRNVGAYAPSTSTSLTNYIANFTNGTPSSEMDFSTSYNPYLNSSADWLSILAYNSYLINNLPGQNDKYAGLYQNGTKADADIYVHERGYVDEYSFNFGGGVNNTVYWGVGIGVQDINYTRQTVYSESLEDARIYQESNGTSSLVTGDAGYYLNNYKHLSGTGWNVKLGLIFKPVNEFRIGLAFHTPTWYQLDYSYDGSVNYSYAYSNGTTLSNDSNQPEYTEYAGFNWRLRSPWKFDIGAAAVIGSSLIVSADYEYAAYPKTSVKYAVYDNYGYLTDYRTDEYVDQNIKDYTQAANTVRLGVEYRLTPAVSLRAGYNITTSNINSETREGRNEVLAMGTDPSYSLDKTTQNIGLGIGYRFGKWYLDGAYVLGVRNSQLKPYTNWGDNTAPTFDIKETQNSVVLSLGYRF